MKTVIRYSVLTIINLIKLIFGMSSLIIPSTFCFYDFSLRFTYFFLQLRNDGIFGVTGFWSVRSYRSLSTIWPLFFTHQPNHVYFSQYHHLINPSEKKPQKNRWTKKGCQVSLKGVTSVESGVLHSYNFDIYFIKELNYN